MTAPSDAVALVTAWRADDQEALDLVLDDADCRAVAVVLARWVSDALDDHLRGPAATTRVLRRAGLRFADREDAR